MNQTRELRPRHRTTDLASERPAVARGAQLPFARPTPRRTQSGAPVAMPLTLAGTRPRESATHDPTGRVLMSRKDRSDSIFIGGTPQ